MSSWWIAMSLFPYERESQEVHVVDPQKTLVFCYGARSSTSRDFWPLGSIYRAKSPTKQQRTTPALKALKITPNGRKQRKREPQSIKMPKWGLFMWTSWTVLPSYLILMPWSLFTVTRLLDPVEGTSHARNEVWIWAPWLKNPMVAEWMETWWDLWRDSSMKSIGTVDGRILQGLIGSLSMFIPFFYKV